MSDPIFGFIVMIFFVINKNISVSVSKKALQINLSINLWVHYLFIYFLPGSKQKGLSR